MCVTYAPFPIVSVRGLDRSAQFVQSCVIVSLCHVSTSQVFAEVAKGKDRGENGKWVVQGQQKTHTSLKSVGFMFKVNRFGTLYFADVHEV